MKWKNKKIKKALYQNNNPNRTQELYNSMNTVRIKYKEQKKGILTNHGKSLYKIIYVLILRVWFLK